MALRDIKQRIKSVKSTKQITNAMNLVASSKLQRIKGRVVSARPFLHELRSIISSIVEQTENLENIYIKGRPVEDSPDNLENSYINYRPVENSLVIVIAGDRGLCGAYNSNVLKEAESQIRARENVKVALLGAKTLKFFSDKDCNIVKYVTGISDKPFYDDAASIGDLALEMFESGEIDEVLVVYTKFESMLSYQVMAERILPVDITKFAPPEDAPRDYNDIMEFEPDAAVILEYLLPKYVKVFMFDAMLESAACELAARAASMDNATKNADERIEEMSLAYNRARQSVITKEIIEIVAGANALN